MTPAEICALSHASVARVQALKQGLDIAFERLIATGSREDLQKVEVLQQQTEDALRHLPIAWSIEKINDKTLVYMGKLETDIFQKLPSSIEHIYTSFPEGEIHREHLQIGTETNKELQALMQKSGIVISDFAKLMMDGSGFRTPQQPEQIDLIRLRVSDLGLSGKPTTDEIYSRIAELGLELCPPATALYYRLAHLDQPMDDGVTVGMKPITIDGGSPSVFHLVHSLRAGLWLNDAWARPGTQWDLDLQFLFRVRKQT